MDLFWQVMEDLRSASGKSAQKIQTQAPDAYYKMAMAHSNSSAPSFGLYDINPFKSALRIVVHPEKPRLVRVRRALSTALDRRPLRNQADRAEKSARVQRMGSIYENAKAMFAYLGPSDEASDLATEVRNDAGTRLFYLGIPEAEKLSSLADRISLEFLMIVAGSDALQLLSNLDRETFRILLAELPWLEEDSDAAEKIKIAFLAFFSYAFWTRI
ncbi:hypothetical protein NA57DRAFT_82071 [Rhizodiscina lignyota]|uniref:Heterokaryon incompatibility domain-containing protein n=1 Tax=Rhizodiscina lignyota TaxID=1504668 RepID=A0A9P4I3W2_9PEZI|nr:hypothetical protein NA57DRAFT_82071 [Rhizodiscina lignyota]